MGHFYDKDGKPRHWVENKSKGGTRTTRITDARKHGYVPSVTEILRTQDKPGLTNWLQREPLKFFIQNVNLFAHVDPCGNEHWNHTEPDAFASAVIKASTEKTKDDTADLGTLLHEAMELWAKGKPVAGEVQPYVDEFKRIMVDEFHMDLRPAPHWKPEHTFSNGRWGGMIDLWIPQGNYPGGGEHVLIDYKSKDFTKEDMKGSRFKLHYDEHIEQLAGYAEGLDVARGDPPAWSNAYRAFSVFLSRNEPGTVHVHEWENEEKELGLTRFLALFDFWCAKKRYWPGQEVDSDGAY